MSSSEHDSANQFVSKPMASGVVVGALVVCIIFVMYMFDFI